LKITEVTLTDDMLLYPVTCGGQHCCTSIGVIFSVVHCTL